MLKSLKQSLRDHSVTIGSWITIGHPSVVEIMAKAGFDWLSIDLEHSAIDLAQAQVLVATIQAHDMAALVRVTENDPKLIQRVMDMGVSGVIVPMVNSKEQAEQAVRAVRYPPRGTRGAGLARAQSYGLGFDEYAARINDDSMVIVQVEHIAAVNNLEAILAVEGIDGIMIGPYDLSASLGHPGQFDLNSVAEAVSRAESICKAKGVPLGFHVIQPDARLIQDKIKDGYTFLAFSLDSLFLGRSCIAEMKRVVRPRRNA